MSFGQHLRGLREGAGLTRAALARRVGVPAGTLRNWEADQGFPGVRGLMWMARAMGVPVERLAVGVEDPAGQGAEPAEGEVHRARKGRAL